LRSPPHKRKDVTGPQRRTAFTARVTGAARQGSRLGHCPDYAESRKVTILVCTGRNKKPSPDLGTLEQHRQEVKSTNKINREERGRVRP
jgi:hypothetical protein